MSELYFDPSKFTTPAPKPLPIILLLDVSYSMSGGKITSLNQAVKEMLRSFSDLEKMETEIWTAVITFGREVQLHIPYTKASEIVWIDLNAEGSTPMGTALKMAKAMIEDKGTTPSRAYRPTVVLVSDGHPNDSWQKPLQEFISQGRSSKCDRMAMAIGKDADEDVLNQFIEDTPHDLFYASNASELREFFKMVTMSVSMRSTSANPNQVLALPAHEPTQKKLENREEDYW